MFTNIIMMAKEKWWVILIVAIIAILMLIPAQVGLPSDKYRGCDNDDPKYISYCQYGEIKSITEKSDGTVIITVPVKFSDGTKDTIFYLSKGHSKFSIGSTVLVNYASWENKFILFINSDSNLLMSLVLKSDIVSIGSTAVIDATRMTEIKSTP